MIAEKKILIAGGDLRQLYCARRLSEKYQTSITGFDKDFFPADFRLINSAPDNTSDFDYIVLPVTPVEDDGLLKTPCSSARISFSEIKNMLRPDGVVFTGKVDEQVRSLLGSLSVYDYLCREDLSLLNAIPSAEGAIQIALEELPVTLNGLKVLIVGFGRIGSALSGILKGFGADVTAAVRNPDGSARARIAGIKSCSSKNIDCNYQLVFNTVPSMIFDYELMKRFDKNTLFIDLASKPGGMDFKAAADLGIKAIWALGLPGKTAPITSGEIIADTISEIISERNETDG